VANDHTLTGHTNGVALIGEKSIHRRQCRREFRKEIERGGNLAAGPADRSGERSHRPCTEQCRSRLPLRSHCSSRDRAATVFSALSPLVV
jgi:hypothetical protein